MYSNILTLESNPIQISRLEELTAKIISRFDLNPNKYAIVHGNQYDKSKKVLINVSTNDALISLQVCDEGAGFDFTQLPDPTIPENIEAPRGRGIFVIKALCDACNFQDPGNKIEMDFKRI